MKLTRVGVDLAKQVFQVHGVDRAERPAWCKRLKRARWIADLERDVEPGAEAERDALDRVAQLTERRVVVEVEQGPLDAE